MDRTLPCRYRTKGRAGEGGRPGGESTSGSFTPISGVWSGFYVPHPSTARWPSIASRQGRSICTPLWSQRHTPDSQPKPVRASPRFRRPERSRKRSFVPSELDAYLRTHDPIKSCKHIWRSRRTSQVRTHLSRPSVGLAPFGCSQTYRAGGACLWVWAVADDNDCVRFGLAPPPPHTPRTRCLVFNVGLPDIMIVIIFLGSQTRMPWICF